MDLDHIEQVCRSALRTIGYEIVDVEHSRVRSRSTLRVFIDHPHSVAAQHGVSPRRITHGDCSRASVHLRTLLDIESGLGDDYRLEVSSPGLFRALKRSEDFERFIGFKARVTLRDPLEGRRNFSGLIVAVDGLHVVLRDTKRANAPRSGDENISDTVASVDYRLEIDTVRKARLDEEY